jgi:N-methylhydantoinase B/oxoprolinase/acetone carboxylase alpha subunit
MLLTGFELPMRSLRQRYRDEELHEGDIIIFNDPYAGGQHIMDLITFAPVHYEGQGERLVGFVGSIAHHSDMGGAAPGGTAGGLTEIYQEGLRFPFVKLYKKGQEDEELFGILRNNIRVPRQDPGRHPRPGLGRFRGRAADAKTSLPSTAWTSSRSARRCCWITRRDASARG